VRKKIYLVLHDDIVAEKLFAIKPMIRSEGTRAYFFADIFDLIRAAF
jgi:hypothetical protein